MKRTEESISLAGELTEITEVLRSAQFIAELMATDAMPDVDAEAQAPRMLEAVLTLAVGRLRLLRKVVVGEASAGLLVCRQNRALAPLRGDDPDVVLPQARQRGEKK